MAILATNQLHFRLSTHEHRRLRELVYATGLPKFYAVAMAATFGLQFVATLLAHGQLFWAKAGLLISGAGCSAMLASIAYARLRPRRLAVEADLTLCETGLSGTVDGLPAAIAWSDIAHVRDLGDAIVVMRRRSLGALAIPKTSITNPGSLWSEFEERLISKRALIRSGRPLRQIQNSAC